MSEQQVFEFRGVDNLYIAEVLTDDDNNFVCDTPIHLAPVAEVSKATDSSNEAHYYDNKAMIVINSEGPDNISITMAPPILEKLALIIGKTFDSETGMLIDSPRVERYFALMYRTKGTDGKYRYVSRLKGQFNIPDETSATEDDSTDANNTQVEYTGIYTTYEFTKGKKVNGNWEKAGAKGIVVDTRYGLVDVSHFFDNVQTPDTIGNTVAVTGVGLAPSSLSLLVGDTAQLTATVVPNNATDKGVTFASDDGSVALVDDNGEVSAIGAGSATLTVTTDDGSFTDTCSVTVTAP